MSLDYLQQNLSMALASMATSSKPFTARLVDVFPAYIIKLREEDFPEYLRSKFSVLMSEYRNHIKHIGSISILQMHPKRARKLIKAIGDLEFSVVTEMAYPMRNC